MLGPLRVNKRVLDWVTAEHSNHLILSLLDSSAPLCKFTAVAESAYSDEGVLSGQVSQSPLGSELLNQALRLRLLPRPHPIALLRRPCRYEPRYEDLHPLVVSVRPIHSHGRETSLRFDLIHCLRSSLIARPLSCFSGNVSLC